MPISAAYFPYRRGDDLVQEYKERCGEQTLLGFSRGKDSIATALLLRDKLDVYPVYCYTIPGLSFIEEGLEYYSKHLFDGRRIIQYPEGAFLRWLRSGLYQTPHSYQIIHSAHLALTTHDWWREIVGWVIDDLKLKETTLNATGITIRDSPRRFFNIKMHGVIRPSVRNWAPIWDYDRSMIVEAISKAGISLPIDYLLFGRSFGGALIARYFVPIKRHRPKDWQIILDWFPNADIAVWKYERFIEGKR